MSKIPSIVTEAKPTESGILFCLFTITGLTTSPTLPGRTQLTISAIIVAWYAVRKFIFPADPKMICQRIALNIKSAKPATIAGKIQQ